MFENAWSMENRFPKLKCTPDVLKHNWTEHFKRNKPTKGANIMKLT